MMVATLFFSPQFYPAIRDGRMFHTFRRAARDGEMDVASIRPGQRVQLIFDMPRLVPQDVIVANVEPARIGRHPNCEGGIACMRVGEIEFGRREIEVAAWLLGFGCNDRSGDTARIRMGRFYRHVFPGDGAIAGHVLSWHPPGGTARALEVLRLAQADADRVQEVQK